MNLYQHQIDALDATKGKNRVAYYLDMGLGKTFVGSEKMMRLGEHVNLVVCQKSKIDDWIEHFKTYYSDFYVYNLTDKKQMTAFVTILSHDLPPNYTIVGVINYELLWRRKTLIAAIDKVPYTLMLDESSLISNEQAKRTRAILKMRPQKVILLSGTPTAGKYEKLWSQVRLLGWNISKSAFWLSYVVTEWIETNDFFYREVVVGYKNVEHLRMKLAEYGCVFMKTDEVMSLPEQIAQKIFVKPSADYKKFVKNSYLPATEQHPELAGDNSLTKALYARQLCGQYSKDKLAAFEDLVNSTEDRLIVFYNFTAELDALERIARKRTDHISVVNGHKRDITAYNDYDDSITFIQYQAGAMGGNFQKANKVIYYTLPLGKGSCDLWEQSKKRIHRIGQDRGCIYYYLLVKGSIEERNLAALKEGKELTDELFIPYQDNN